MPKIQIALLGGGNSSEHKISIKSSDSIFSAIDKDKYEIFRYNPKEDLAKFFIDATTKKFSFVVPVLHGENGEDGRLQGMLELLNMPFMFSGSHASAVAINKHTSKVIAKNLDINVAKDIIISKGHKFDTKQIIRTLGVPVVVKPLHLGSSVGMGIAHTADEIKTAVNEAFKVDDEIMLESYIKGREFSVGIFGNKMPEALPVVEILPNKASWFDYNSKYDEDGADEICPATVPEELKAQLQDNTKKIYVEIGCRDLARVDFILDTEMNILYFLEINTIPGLTTTSILPKEVKASGQKFADFVNQLLDESIADSNVEIKS